MMAGAETASVPPPTAVAEGGDEPDAKRARVEGDAGAAAVTAAWAMSNLVRGPFAEALETLMALEGAGIGKCAWQSVSRCGSARTGSGSREGALRSHELSHGYRDPYRLYAPSNGICPNCGADHRSRHRLIRHLQRAKKCRYAFEIGALPRLTYDVIEQAEHLLKSPACMSASPAQLPRRR